MLTIEENICLSILKSLPFVAIKKKKKNYTL